MLIKCTFAYVLRFMCHTYVAAFNNTESKKNFIKWWCHELIQIITKRGCILKGKHSIRITWFLYCGFNQWHWVELTVRSRKYISNSCFVITPLLVWLSKQIFYFTMITLVFIIVPSIVRKLCFISNVCHHILSMHLWFLSFNYYKLFFGKPEDILCFNLWTFTSFLRFCTSSWLSGKSSHSCGTWWHCFTEVFWKTWHNSLV